MRFSRNVVLFMVGCVVIIIRLELCSLFSRWFMLIKLVGMDVMLLVCFVFRLFIMVWSILVVLYLWFWLIMFSCMSVLVRLLIVGKFLVVICFLYFWSRFWVFIRWVLFCRILVYFGIMVVEGVLWVMLFRVIS